MWAALTGKRAPHYLPRRWINPFVPLVKQLERRFRLPTLVSSDAIAILDATYLAHSGKASRELGWQARSLEAGMRQVFESLAQNPPPPPVKINPKLNQAQRRKLLTAALVFGSGLAAVWLMGRPKKKRRIS